MQFHILTHTAGRDHSGDPTFTLEQVLARRDGRSRDVSHLIDRTYGYRSMREVQWHLADRFGMVPGSVEIEGAEVRREHPLS